MGEGKDMNRRNFLKSVGGAAIVGALGLGAKKLVDLDKAWTKENRKHIKKGEAIITKKVSQEGSTGVGYHPVSVGPDFGGGFRSDTEPDSYKIIINFNGKEIEKKVSKQEFDSYQEGQKIPVVYNEKTMEITSTKKEIIEYYRQNP